MRNKPIMAILLTFLVVMASDGWGGTAYAAANLSPISTVAGNGSYGYSGDGGAATSAQLYRPNAVAVDSSGNLYIADEYNSVIRKVDTSGNISTVAGNGNYGYSGDGGAATSAQLGFPYGVV